MGQFGVQTTSIIAVLGAAGLAIGLALQGTLSNVAAGVMLLLLRPFNTGDWVETGDVSGTIKEVGLFTTIIDTFDNVYVSIPNSSIWNSILKPHNPGSLVCVFKPKKNMKSRDRNKPPATTEFITPA